MDNNNCGFIQRIIYLLFPIVLNIEYPSDKNYSHTFFEFLVRKTKTYHENAILISNVVFYGTGTWDRLHSRMILYINATFRSSIFLVVQCGKIALAD